jgi:NADPH:quinone reductase-like Zn-dependent oxidoreductase
METSPSTAPTDTGELATMRAVRRHRYGPPSSLVVESTEVPTPAPGEVLVRVRAASLDRGAWHFTTGIPYIARPTMGLRRPKAPGIGWDVAGVIARVGAGVSELAVGDEVFGTGRSTFAGYAISTPKHLARKPAVSFEIAAAIPVSALTALQALRDKAAVQPGQRVLVVGASGGVGLYTVQIAKALGATVTAVCSARKADVVLAAGAVRVIAHDIGEPSSGSDRYDVVVDIGGNRSVRWLRGSLTPKGTLVIVGGEGKGKVVGIGRQLRAMALSPFVRQRMLFFIANTNRSDLELLGEMVEDGRIRPHLDRVVGLDAVAATMDDMIAGRITGKAVFVP